MKTCLAHSALSPLPEGDRVRLVFIGINTVNAMKYRIQTVVVAVMFYDDVKRGTTHDMEETNKVH